MVIADHINLQPDTPLRGANLDALGPRFPDMSAPYDQGMRELVLEIADRENIVLYQGVYASVAGPQLETKAEYRYLKIIGADAVGMSTVPEVIAAVHMGMPCVAVSVLTDECDPEALAPFDLNEVIAIAKDAEPKLTRLFVELVSSMP
jgi:purine-nucleoside phosphorylase